MHSPGPIDDRTRARIQALGRVAVIVAPGNFHHLHVASCQRAFAGAETWICPGVQRKQPELRYEGVLGDVAPPCLSPDFELAPVFGRVMSEVAMLHRASRTLLLVDLLENFGAGTPGVNWTLKALWRLFGMWNVPQPAPEYRFGFRNRAQAHAALEQIMAWDFERIVFAHGALIEQGARATLERAWQRYLPRSSGSAPR